MSLNALAIRTSAFLALHRATLAEDRVYDSALSPTDEMSSETPRPFILISIDEASGKPEGARELLSATDILILVIEMGVGTKVDVEGSDDQTITIPHTDPGQEIILDLLSYQVKSRLTAMEPWPNLFRSFVLKISEVRTVRGGGADQGIRFASRQISLILEPIADPPQGGELDGVWLDFLEALRAIDAEEEPDFALFPQLADAIQNTVESPALPWWKVEAQKAGVTIDEAAAIALRPIAELPDGEDVPIEDDPLVTMVSILGQDIDIGRADQTDMETDAP